MNVTFEAFETVKVIKVNTIYDDIKEANETFKAMILPVEGVFPVDVTNSIVTIEIIDSGKHNHTSPIIITFME